jgi:uncharacterized protein YjbI with pentapeptide repeats
VTDLGRRRAGHLFRLQNVRPLKLILRSSTLLKKTLEQIALSPVKSTAIVIALVAALVVWISSDYYGTEGFYSGVLVEAHGMILDLIVVGLILLLIETFRERRQAISHNKELIDDLRYWKSDEASYRLRGSILRLNRMGITSLNLEGAHLKRLDMQSVRLAGSKLFSADFGEADLRKVDISKCNLKGAYLGDADCRGASLEASSMYLTRCRRAKFTGSTFESARLEKTEFFDCDLQNANFSSAELLDCKFTGARLRHADFRTARINSIEQFEGAEDLEYALFDLATMLALESRYQVKFSQQRKDAAK